MKFKIKSADLYWAVKFCLHAILQLNIFEIFEFKVDFPCDFCLFKINIYFFLLIKKKYLAPVWWHKTIGSILTFNLTFKFKSSNRETGNREIEKFKSTLATAFD